MTQQKTSGSLFTIFRFAFIVLGIQGLTRLLGWQGYLVWGLGFLLAIGIVFFGLMFTELRARSARRIETFDGLLMIFAELSCGVGLFYGAWKVLQWNSVLSAISALTLFALMRWLSSRQGVNDMPSTTA